MDEAKNYKVLLWGEKPSEPHQCWIQLNRPTWIGGQLLPIDTDLPGTLLLCECEQHWLYGRNWGRKMPDETWTKVSSRRANKTLAKLDKSKR